MKNRASLYKNGFYYALAVFAVLLMLSVTLYVFEQAHAAEPDTATVTHHLDTPPVYAERGMRFDPATLPATLPVLVKLSDESITPMSGRVSWHLSEQNLADAAVGNDFTVSGSLTTVEAGDGTVYTAAGLTDCQTTVRFIGRGPTSAFSLTVREQPFLSTIFDLTVTVCVHKKFSMQSGSQTVLEYSFGEGYTAVPLDEAWAYTAETDMFDTQIRLVNADFAGDGELPFDAAVLKKMITDTVFFRLNTTGGLFAGYSNTVTLSGNSMTGGNEHDGDGSDSGFLKPPGIYDGSHGGGTSFWTTPSGTASAVAIGICAVVASIAVGYAVSLLVFKVSKPGKKSKGSDHASDGDDHE